MIARRVPAAVVSVLLLVGAASCTSNSNSASSTSDAVASTTTPPAATMPAPQVSSSTDPSAAAPTTDATSEPATTKPASTETATTGPVTTAVTSTSTTAPAAPACTAPTDTTPVQAASADGGTQEWSITSFDGTVIRAHWFPVELAAGATAPTVLMGPGWGSAGDTNPGTAGDQINIASLQAAGFNVLTWDPRGFGASTGTVEVDSPQFEGRDVQQLIDWVATQPQVELDGARDPRMGMVGASYGGGIQLVTAAIDCRIDAIVPIIAWHSLQTSLFKADTPKTGWAGFLAAVATGRQLDPTIARTDAAGLTGVVDPADVQWFADRGPGASVAQITVPTLIIQGTVDTLFTLQEGVDNYEALTADGVPTAMLWFCGGHGACLTPAGDQSRSATAALAWLRHYVKGETDVTLGAAFEFVDQDGASYTADQFPLAAGTPLTVTGTGTLSLVADGGAGPATITGPGFTTLVAPITPGKATNAVDVSVSADTESVIVGAPQLTLTYSGTTPDGTAPTRVFAQLVDDSTGLVLGNQITPIDVTLDGTSQTATVPLEMVAFTAHPGSSLTLQIVAATVAYAQPRFGGSIDFQAIDLSLPVVTGATKLTG